jgi:hypothetical protein
MLVTVRALLSTNSKSTDPAKYHWLTREFFHGLLVWHLPAALWVLCLTATADLLCESLLRCALHTHVATTSDMPPIDHLSHYFEVSSVLEPSVRRYLSIAIILWPHSCLNSQTDYDVHCSVPWENVDSKLSPFFATFEQHRIRATCKQPFTLL